MRSYQDDSIKRLSTVSWSRNYKYCGLILWLLWGMFLAVWKYEKCFIFYMSAGVYSRLEHMYAVAEWMLGDHHTAGQPSCWFPPELVYLATPTTLMLVLLRLQARHWSLAASGGRCEPSKLLVSFPAGLLQGHRPGTVCLLPTGDWKSSLCCWSDLLLDPFRAVGWETVACF